MPSASASRSVVAAESTSAKLTNEDYCHVYTGKHFCALGIADGVGSSAESHIAAELCVTRFLECVGNSDRQERALSIDDLRSFWQTAASSVKTHYEQNKSKYATLQSPLETTLITAIDCPDCYLIGYLGNGSLWLIRGDFWEFSDRRWPWSLSDLMVGHSTLDENGREALYGLINHEGTIGEARFITISKDHRCGEILLLTTDGVSSQDHLKVGYDSNEKLWIEVNPQIQRLVSSYLPPYIADVAENKRDPVRELDALLRRFLAEGTFDDDATIGTMVSPAVIEYYALTGKRPRAL